MQVEDIRVFIPSKDYEVSKTFYKSLGFSMAEANENLTIFENGGSTFFLQRYFNQQFAENLMLQLIVADIEEAFKTISGLTHPNIRYEPIKDERWGRVIYLWGPAGELLHITQLNTQ
tara:strand:- start:106 stop:456 length:351 start_codon:yes stop_codon:yes gene_type:complete